VLITTDLDRTLLFSRRATAQLGGALPAEPVETPGGPAAHETGAELCHAACDCLAALPAHATICVATSRSVSRLARLRLPFATPYAIAANGGVVLVDGAPDQCWATRTKRLLAAAAPATEVRAVLAGRDGRGRPDAGPNPGRAPAWLLRMGDDDELCCLAIVDLALFGPGELRPLANRCGELGWEASLIGRKLYAFPVGFGKEHAALYVAERMAALAGAAPRRLAAGDTEHDRRMLAGADVAWVPAGSELAAWPADGEFTVTRQPGHAAAAQITSEWLGHCRDGGLASW
jgi:hypothetical protein